MPNFIEKIQINQQLTQNMQVVKSTHLEIKKMWRIIGTKDQSILELRAIWPPAGNEPCRPTQIVHFRSNELGGICACKSAFESEALRLNALGYNIYAAMNPIKSTFNGFAVKDDDISYRNLLLIDIDRSQKNNEPASEGEVEAAKQLADKVTAYLATNNWPAPIRVMSGNGHHLYYELPPTPNDDESKHHVQKLLKYLAAEFDNEIVKIDTSVFNASRITKVVGTIARKGLESEGRPYRMAVVL
jgi:hypothetical protein